MTPTEMGRLWRGGRSVPEGWGSRKGRGQATETAVLRAGAAGNRRLGRLLGSRHCKHLQMTQTRFQHLYISPTGKDNANESPAYIRNKVSRKD